MQERILRLLTAVLAIPLLVCLALAGLPSPALANTIAAGGEYYSLGVKADGTVMAWGQNGQGQCNVPPGLTGVTAVAPGSWHSLALTDGGMVVGWGLNDSGQCNVPAREKNYLQGSS
jgi:alpha-tubulin suppressor-like RCC1 family protein